MEDTITKKEWVKPEFVDLDAENTLNTVNGPCSDGHTAITAGSSINTTYCS